MTNYTPILLLPQDIQRDWSAEVFSATPTKEGCFRLVDIHRTDGKGYQGQRITVLVVDENGIAMPGIPVAFSFSTADQYTLTADFAWMPPTPRRAFIIRTGGGGEIDMVLGAEGVVKAGQAGGVTVYVLQPEYSSDVITGCGQLADHTGMYITMQLRQAGVVPLSERLGSIEERLAKLENQT